MKTNSGKKLNSGKRSIIYAPSSSLPVHPQEGQLWNKQTHEEWEGELITEWMKNLFLFYWETFVLYK